MSKKTEIGNLLAIPLKNGLWAAAQIIESTDNAGLFWVAGFGEHFEKIEEITTELIGSSEPVIFGLTMDALLKRGDWQVAGWTEKKATDYRPAFRRLISSQGVFVADVFHKRQRLVDESEIAGLPNEFSTSPAGVASVIMRFPVEEQRTEYDKELLIKPEWDVKNFFQD